MKAVLLSILLTISSYSVSHADNIINKNLECPRCNNYTYTENYNTNYTKHYFGICSTCHYESSDESMIDDTWNEAPVNNNRINNRRSDGSEISNIQDKEIREAYNNLPESVKQLFINTESEIREVEHVTDSYGNYIFGAAGMFSTDGSDKYHVIQIDTESDMRTTYHEFFHLVDCGYNGKFESEEDEFVNIYYAERYSFEATDGNTDYARSSSTEYFACAGEEYIVNPNKLRANAPMTYNYIHNAVNNIK